MRHPTARIAVLLTCLAGAACGRSTAPEQASGNSNWLRVCANDERCDGDARCLCGVCTRPCDEPEECGAEPNVSCLEPPTGRGDETCAAAAGRHAGICQRTCEEDSACAGGQVCRSGICVASADTGGGVDADAGALSAVSSGSAGGEAGTNDGPGAAAVGVIAPECGPDSMRCDPATSLAALIQSSRNATAPADPNTRVWSCEAGALRIDPAGYDEAFALAITDDALLIAGTRSSGDGDGRWRIERRGRDDLSPAVAFGTAGVIQSGQSVQWDAAAALAVREDHVYVAGVDGYGGARGPRLRLEKRDLKSGALIASFGHKGQVAFTMDGQQPPPGGATPIGRAFALDGAHAYMGGTGFAVEKRTLRDGARAPDFGDGGVASGAASPQAFASAAALVAGTLYVAGPDGVGGLRLEARAAADGTLVYAVERRFAGQVCEPQCVAMVPATPDGVYVAGSAGGRWHIEQRRRSDGAVTYEVDLEPSGACDIAAAIAEDGDAVYVAGSVDGSWRVEKRARVDGALDPGFGTGGAVEPGLRGSANAIVVRGETLYVAGLEGPRAGVQSSVWRIERRSKHDGSLLPCPAASPAVPRVPSCKGTVQVERASPSSASTAACAPMLAMVASSTPCAATSVRVSIDASAREDWLLPEGAALLDGTTTTADLGDSPSSALLVRGFGFALPHGARVLGIAVDLTRAGHVAGTIADHAVQLVQGDRILPADRARPTPWASTMTLQRYGSPGDLWDASWAPADLNDPGFGVALRARPLTGGGGTARYDAVGVEVHYCQASASTGP